MSSASEATIHPDGSTTFGDATADGNGDTPLGGGTSPDEIPDMNEDSATEKGVQGVDPAMYLALLVVAFVVIFIVMKMRRKQANADVDTFFSNLDGEKFNLKLPAAVEEYYEVKGKCEAEGWEPGQPSNGSESQPSPHHRALAQALMKRCIADIPIVTHIQRESAGMNKLYSQSMCSVRQWKSYQAAEAMVSAEVEEVRAEADEIEPGWSQVIWRQAMQYHNMLKQKEEQAKKNQQEQQKATLEKQRSEEKRKAEIKSKLDEEKARIQAEKARIQSEKDRVALAEKAAEELLKQEEREREAKKGFKSVKKGFLDKK